jgi:hypothetical protein
LALPGCLPPSQKYDICIKDRGDEVIKKICLRVIVQHSSCCLLDKENTVREFNGGWMEGGRGEKRERQRKRKRMSEIDRERNGEREKRGRQTERGRNSPPHVCVTV